MELKNLVDKSRAIRNLIFIVGYITAFAIFGFGLSKFQTLLFIVLFMFLIVFMDLETTIWSKD